MPEMPHRQSRYARTGTVPCRNELSSGKCSCEDNDLFKNAPSLAGASVSSPVNGRVIR